MNKTRASFFFTYLSILFFGQPVFAATFDSSCESSCKASAPGAYLKLESCSSSEDSAPGCVDTDSGSPTFKKEYNCCKPKAGTCTSLHPKASCLDYATCTESDKSTETGFKYKLHAAGCPGIQFCCEPLGPRPGYSPDTYDDTACVKLGGTCLPAPCSGSAPNQVGECGKKETLLFVCCKESLTPKTSESTEAAKAGAAGGATTSVTPTAATPLPEKPLISANPYTYQPPLKNLTINQIVGNIIKGLSPVIGALFFLMFLWGGFLWITAGGDEKKVEKARQVLSSAVIGMAIVVGAYVLISNLISILGGALTKST